MFTVFCNTFIFYSQVRGAVQVRGMSKRDRNNNTGGGHRQRARCVVPPVAEHGDLVRLPYRVQSVRLSSVAFHPKTKVNAS